MNAHKIILNALLMGYEITYKGIAIRLFKDGDTIPMPSGEYISEGYWLGSPMQKGENKVYVGIDMDFIDFLRMCDLQTEEELLSLSASIAMTKVNRESASNRGLVN